MKTRSKGQIFTLDAFLALLLVTISLGLIVAQIESIKNQPSSDLQTLSSDFAQVALKRTLVVNQPNNLSSSKLNDLKSLMDNIFIGTAYEYQVELYNGTTSTIEKSTGCDSMKDVSIAKEPAVVDNQSGYLKIEICK